MAANGSTANIMSRRREAVAALRLRGLSLNQIAAALPKAPPHGPGIYNPTTGGPFDTSTISRDLKALEAEWRANALADRIQHKAQLLAEIEEVKRAAWGAKQYDTLLRAFKQQADLLGLDELPGMDPDWREEARRLTGLSDADIDALFGAQVQVIGTKTGGEA